MVGGVHLLGESSRTEDACDIRELLAFSHVGERQVFHVRLTLTRERGFHIGLGHCFHR